MYEGGAVAESGVKPFDEAEAEVAGAAVDVPTSLTPLAITGAGTARIECRPAPTPGGTPMLPLGSIAVPAHRAETRRLVSALISVLISVLILALISVLISVLISALILVREGAEQALLAAVRVRIADSSSPTAALVAAYSAVLCRTPSQLVDSLVDRSRLGSCCGDWVGDRSGSVRSISAYSCSSSALITDSSKCGDDASAPGASPPLLLPPPLRPLPSMLCRDGCSMPWTLRVLSSSEERIATYASGQERVMRHES